MIVEGLWSKQMHRGQSTSKPELLLGGKYSQLFVNLFDYITMMGDYLVHTFDGSAQDYNPIKYDAAVIDNLVLEEAGDGFIDDLINKNPSIKIIIREMPYRDWRPEAYNHDGLKKLQAAYPSNIIFPAESYLNDTVIEKLENLVHT